MHHPSALILDNVCIFLARSGIVYVLASSEVAGQPVCAVHACTQRTYKPRAAVGTGEPSAWACLLSAWFCASHDQHLQGAPLSLTATPGKKQQQYFSGRAASGCAGLYNMVGHFSIFTAGDK
jgi:hypothetical protein